MARDRTASCRSWTARSSWTPHAARRPLVQRIPRRRSFFYGKLVFASWFNAGVRAIDIREPFSPREVGFFIPRTTANTDTRPEGCKIGVDSPCDVVIQTNNVEVDGRGLIYIVDRANTGMHILRLSGEAAKIAGLPSGDDD